MDTSKLRALEGMGYVAAVMIAVGGVAKSEVTNLFNVLGLVFAVIVIVRLMVMQILYSEGANLMGSERQDDDIDDLSELDVTSGGDGDEEEGDD